MARLQRSFSFHEKWPDSHTLLQCYVDCFMQHRALWQLHCWMGLGLPELYGLHVHTVYLLLVLLDASPSVSTGETLPQMWVKQEGQMINDELRNSVEKAKPKTQSEMPVWRLTKQDHIRHFSQVGKDWDRGRPPKSPIPLACQRLQWAVCLSKRSQDSLQFSTHRAVMFWGVSLAYPCLTVFLYLLPVNVASLATASRGVQNWVMQL